MRCWVIANFGPSRGFSPPITCAITMVSIRPGSSGARRTTNSMGWSSCSDSKEAQMLNLNYSKYDVLSIFRDDVGSVNPTADQIGQFDADLFSANDDTLV